MANGRTTVSRPGHRSPGGGHCVTSAARNKRPRLSSLEGIAARQVARSATVPKAIADWKDYKYHKPGSENPRKVNR